MLRGLLASRDHTGCVTHCITAGGINAILALRICTIAHFCTFVLASIWLQACQETQCPALAKLRHFARQMHMSHEELAGHLVMDRSSLE